MSVTEKTGRIVSYSYDAIYRLISETISSAANPGHNGSITYSYDEVGNRQSRISTVSAITTEQNISVDDNDRLTRDSYDNNGSTVEAKGVNYTYDFENRIIRAEGNGKVVTIKYDGDGNRVEKSVTENGESRTTKYLVDTNTLTGYAQVVEEIEDEVVVKQYTYGLDLISQRQLIDNNRVVHFYGYDGHGSVRFLTDSTGTITDTYDYDAFGNIINQTGSTPNNYLYAGEQFDSDLNLYYNRARYLDVNRGRFWSQDEFEGDREEPNSLNKYVYASSNPINLIDPSGYSGIKSLELSNTIVLLGTLAIVSTLAPLLKQIRPRTPSFPDTSTEEEIQVLPAPEPASEPENNPDQKPGPQRQPNPLPDLEKTRDPGRNFIYRFANNPNNPGSVALRRSIDWQTGLSFTYLVPSRCAVKYFVPTLLAAGYTVRFDEGEPILGLFNNQPIKGFEGKNFSRGYVSVYILNQNE